MSDSSNKIPVFEYEQPGAVFYACILPADQIIDRLEIRRRSSDPDFGIQRDENARRVREISEYATERNAIFPTPVIVSARSNQVVVDGAHLRFVNNEGDVGHVLDGQHRVLGLRELSRSDLRRFNLLVVFVFDIDVYSEATIFSTINGNQKQVSKSLMYDLFSLSPGRSIEKSCHEIARSLHDDPESPFHGRIKILGTKVGPEETLSQAAFVDQLARQIKDRSGSLYEFYIADEDWVIRKILASCFSAIDEVRSDTSQFPQDYFYRTTGYGGVVQALGELVKMGKQLGDVSRDFFVPIMKVFFNGKESPPTGVGNAAMLDIKSRLLAAAASATNG
ncbi:MULTISPECIES: DGQHR domain-containing protein [unclassified Burkholderia]|uniref:DGQHR domain-containing protein n=1 Tax=unclassified Burkholderia TaxID=2613784 RepID=UPI00141FC1A3|nr:MULTISPECIES: DGQHR domain-containing protein [unclassified Burkholderia]NIE82434.1 DGQHR domain-containing protein [Burkholderia sp. Tr-860]NIF61372.1 DGQHR domain-containing protein [Burkholderia sp. Cy-647]NIF95759.1 DGQHR domain-containing protein [Burkholderia sp. Ax-1720]